MLGLAILLSDGNGRGGGDLDSDNGIVGSWAGDQIVIAGDYADPGRFGVDGEKNLYQLCNADDGGFEDISKRVLRAMCEDEDPAEDLKQQKVWCAPYGTVYDFAMSDD
jgi:hypothetical protein